ncbi:MAG: 50S ribosomal protein L29 [Candidatus Wildermuthbacteria bacterium RIFCSPHIGHO2_02_FULL_49_9]|uniref:Large ribosomal subunit protein uL29 n=2 Tax=Candidatus Wildermuthiibacteriota TaxID=1817923 RepID=A0A1G2QWA1_9BACT|nr:MAG: 50S ribosomal protein L29 [Candidatus Wildermuthbacteria bacterium RIFCSPHIGHO2_01_FULL_49_22b]OHA70071.1 MAG: 50S ribosomal protein L29 [Candidatus Wildermuthbacteria bacterium RIFCSPHIGHO2_02_FULL_49_9]
MKLQELRQKSAKELEDMAKGLREKGQELRFQLAAGRVKNVREIRLTRKNIAQVLTVLQEKKQ